MPAVRAEAEPSLRALAEARRRRSHGLRESSSTELEADAVALALRLAEQIVAGASRSRPSGWSTSPARRCAGSPTAAT